MARGRPKLSEDEKARRKEQRLASSAAADWEARLPADPEKRRELFAELHRKRERVASAVKEIKDEVHVAGEVKMLKSVYGFRPETIRIDEIMSKLDPETQTAVWRQIQVRANDAKWDSAPGLFDISAVGATAPEQGSVFDKTASGERHDAERRDDPAKAGKRNGKGAEPKPAETPSMSMDDAEKAFRANASKAPQPADPEEDDDKDLRPRHLQENERQRGLEGADGEGTYRLQ